MIIFIALLFFILTCICLFPLLYGLVLLPLDLLVSNFAPWSEYYKNTILVKNPYMQDSIIQMFPWKDFVYESFAKGIIPFWNPYQLMGMPFMAGMKPMVFYPFSLLYIFGAINAWHVLLFSQIFLSFLFIYILARDFKLGIFPSILASIAYALNALMITTLEFGSEGHVLLWFPIFFLCVKRYFEKQKGRYLMLLGVSLAMSFLAGQVQYFGYGLVTLVIFILLYGKHIRAKLSVFLSLLSSTLFGLGIGAMQLIPSIELFQQSYRGSDVSTLFLQGLRQPYHLFTLLVPDAFGNPVSKDFTPFFNSNTGYFGVIPLFFCLYAIIFIRKNFITKFFSIAFFVSFLLSMDKIGQVLYFLKVPLFTSGSADRVLSIMLFSGAVLSGFGLAEFLKDENKKRNLLSITIFVIVLIAASMLGLAANKFSGQTIFIVRSIYYPLIVSGALVFISVWFLLYHEKINYLKQVFLVAVIGLTFFDLFRMGYRYLTFSNTKFFYPETSITNFVRDSSQSTLGRNYGLVAPELATPLSLYSVETYNPLYPQRTGLLLQALQKGLNDKLPVNKYYLTKNENLKHALDFLGVSFVISTKDHNPSTDYFNTPKYQSELRPVFKDEFYTVYENITSYPRFGLFYEVQQVANDQEALSLISGDNFDFKKKVLLEEKLPIELTEGTGFAQLNASTINSQNFLVETDRPALFYISDTYFPGWHAMINNQETKIYRANYNFRAVPVNSGKSMIEFYYVPTGFIFGEKLSVLSFIALIILSVFHKKISTFNI